MEFRTELEQLLDIIVHSLYSERDIFLRELISNASDALDKLRFEAIADPSLAGDDQDGNIELRMDREARTLSVKDNGIGMSASTIVDQLGTIARSGTKEFLQALRESDATQRPELIGRLALTWETADGLAATAEIEHRGRAFSLTDEDVFEPLARSTALNLGLSWAPEAAGWRAFLRADNVTDTLIEPQFGLPAPGREIRAGLRFRFG